MNFDQDKCPICDTAFVPDDLCATDIELGTCHAACLDGSPVVAALREACLSNAEQKAQAGRCGCRGSDDYCPCQNAPDRQTQQDRLAALSKPNAPGREG